MSRIRNREHLLSRGCFECRELLLDAVEYMLEVCDAFNVVMRSVRLDDGRYMVICNERVDLSRYDALYVIGTGKVAHRMADALTALLGDRISSGLIIVPEHVERTRIGDRVEVCRATHPLPSMRSVECTERLLSLAESAGRDDLLIFLISGGGSSLLEMPYPGVSIEEVQEITSMLLRSGARIDEINAVRKHLSLVKGGRLVERLRCRNIVSLILSDVIGNRIDAIASGPASGDSTTFRDAMLILKRYGLWESASIDVRRVIEDGMAGRIRETPKPGDPIFSNVRNFILADNSYACTTTSEFFASRGMDARIMSTRIHGEARYAGSLIAAIAYEVSRYSRPFTRPVAMVLGGETTVSVKANGRGGRNQELALSALISAMMMDSMEWSMAAVATDGIDGNSGNAGALIDRSTADSTSLYDAESCLAGNDSARFFEMVGDAIVTGPTGTNLNDVVIVFVP